MTDLVYPGAMHTRFQHALGAMHLMSLVLDTLRFKGIEISAEEYDVPRFAQMVLARRACAKNRTGDQRR